MKSAQNESTPPHEPLHLLVHMPPGYAFPIAQIGFAIAQSDADTHESPMSAVAPVPLPAGSPYDNACVYSTQMLAKSDIPSLPVPATGSYW